MHADGKYTESYAHTAPKQVATSPVATRTVELTKASSSSIGKERGNSVAIAWQTIGIAW